MLVSGGTMALQEEPLFDSFENGFFPQPKTAKRSKCIERDSNPCLKQILPW